MATILRTWSYRYQWIYNIVSAVAALAVGGEGRLRRLPLAGLTITPETAVLDLCCGAAAVTQILVQQSQRVTALDASPKAIARAQAIAPQATYIQAFAEAMPLPDQSFDLVHTAAAFHEMEPEQLRQILQEVFRVLKPGGVLTFVDLHAPTNPLFWPGLATFMGLFETETAWQFIQTDMLDLLAELGFVGGDGQTNAERTLHAGGSLQVVHAYKPG